MHDPDYCISSDVYLGSGTDENCFGFMRALPKHVTPSPDSRSRSIGFTVEHRKVLASHDQHGWSIAALHGNFPRFHSLGGVGRAQHYNVRDGTKAQELLEEKGIMARVVSLPSWKLFDAQPAGYRNSVLPSKVRARVSIEAAATMGWERYVGIEGVALGISHFGASAPAGVLYEKFGLTAQRMAEQAEVLVKRERG